MLISKKFFFLVLRKVLSRRTQEGRQIISGYKSIKYLLKFLQSYLSGFEVDWIVGLYLVGGL